MKKRNVSAIVVAILASAGIALATSQGNDYHVDMPPSHQEGNIDRPKGDVPYGFNQLQLTAEQKAKIKKIMDENRPEKPKDDSQQQRREKFKQKIEQQRQQEQELLSKKQFDEQVARKMIQQRQQEREAFEKEKAERELQMLKTRHAVFQVLTPEQQKQYLENQKQHNKRRFQRTDNFMDGKAKQPPKHDR